jgi:hypothetical protein
MTRTAWWARVAVVGFAVGLASGAVTTAQANVGAAAAFSVRVVEEVSRSTDSDKSVTAMCPTGTKVYSAGGGVDNRSGNVVVDAIRPLPDLSGVVVSARSLAATAPWAVTAYAVCGKGDPVLVSGNALGAALVEFKQESVSCPVAGSLTGLGGEVVGNDGVDKATLYGLVPDDGPTTATAKGSGPTDAQWAMKAWAICDAELAGLLVRVVAGKGELSGAYEQSVTAKCDDGYQLVGGGGSAVGNAPDDKAILVEAKPDPETDSMTAVGLKGASPWSMQAYAICLKEA